MLPQNHLPIDNRQAFGAIEPNHPNDAMVHIKNLSKQIENGENQSPDQPVIEDNLSVSTIPPQDERYKDIQTKQIDNLRKDIDKLSEPHKANFNIFKDILNNSNLTYNNFKDILKIKLAPETKQLYLELLHYIAQNIIRNNNTEDLNIVSNKTHYANALKYNVKLFVQVAEQNNIAISPEVISMILSNGLYYHLDRFEDKLLINDLNFNLSTVAQDTTCKTCDIIYNNRTNNTDVTNNTNVTDITDVMYIPNKEQKYIENINEKEIINIFDTRTMKRFIMSFYHIIMDNSPNNILNNTINNELLLILSAIFYLGNGHYRDTNTQNDFNIKFKNNSKDHRRNLYKNILNNDFLTNLEKQFFKHVKTNNVFKSYINNQQNLNPKLKEFIAKNINDNKQSGGATVSNDNDPKATNTLANVDDGKYDNYYDTVQTWLDKYQEIQDNYTKFLRDFNEKVNKYKNLITSGNDSIKTFMDEFQKPEAITNSAKFSNLKSSLNNIKSEFKEFDTTHSIKDFNTLLDNITNLDNTIVEKIKGDKTLKMLFKEKDFETFKRDIIGDHKRLISSIKDKLTNYYNLLKYSEVKNIVQKIESMSSYMGKIMIDATKNSRNSNNNDYQNSISDTGNEILSKLPKIDSDSLNSVFNFEEILKSAKPPLELQSKTSDITTRLEKLKGNIKHRNKTAINKVVDSVDHGDERAGQYNSPSMYQRLWDRYLEDVSDSDKLLEDSQDKLYSAFKSNNLDPKSALVLTREDKVLFVLIVFVIRQIVLSIIDIIIEKDLVTSLFACLLCYIGFYVLFMIIIMFIINMDDYKLRIMFNYFNMHVNSNGFIMHIILIIGFTLIMYSLIYNMNHNLDTPTKNMLTEVEKLRLTYKLELMTIAVFVFVAASDLILT